MGSRNLPIVSIIIPVHNSGSWIRGTIDNALSQTYPCCEIIVIDDGSTDNTKHLIDAHYGDSVKYFYQDNAGPARARNRGIEVARGAYIQFLDSDDFLTPDKIALQMEIFTANPECHVVYCDFAYVLENEGGKHEQSPAEKRANYGTPNVFEGLLSVNFLVIHSPLIRSEIVKNCGGFDETLSSDEDYDFWLRVAAMDCKFYYLPLVLAFYRMRSNSISTNFLKQSNGTLQVLAKAKSYRVELTKRETSNLKMKLSREHGWRASFFINQDNYSDALLSVKRSISNNARHGLVIVALSLKLLAKRILNRHLIWRLRGQ